MGYSPRRRRQSAGGKHPLALQLVHRQRRGEHVRSGDRYAIDLERTLQRAVFAAAAVEQIEYPIVVTGGDLLQQTPRTIDDAEANAKSLQSLSDRCAAAQRDFALAAFATN